MIASYVADAAQRVWGGAWAPRRVVSGARRSVGPQGRAGETGVGALAVHPPISAHDEGENERCDGKKRRQVAEKVGMQGGEKDMGGHEAAGVVAETIVHGHTSISPPPIASVRAAERARERLL